MASKGEVGTWSDGTQSPSSGWGNIRERKIAKPSRWRRFSLWRCGCSHRRWMWPSRRYTLCRICSSGFCYWRWLRRPGWLLFFPLLHQVFAFRCPSLAASSYFLGIYDNSGHREEGGMRRSRYSTHHFRSTASSCREYNTVSSGLSTTSRTIMMANSRSSICNNISTRVVGLLQTPSRRGYLSYNTTRYFCTSSGVVDSGDDKANVIGEFIILFVTWR